MATTKEGAATTAPSASANDGAGAVTVSELADALSNLLHTFSDNTPANREWMCDVCYRMNEGHLPQCANPHCALVQARAILARYVAQNSEVPNP